jgi:hypothetical protein
MVRRWSLIGHFLILYFPRCIRLPRLALRYHDADGARSLGDARRRRRRVYK